MSFPESQLEVCVLKRHTNAHWLTTTHTQEQQPTFQKSPLQHDGDAFFINIITNTLLLWTRPALSGAWLPISGQFLAPLAARSDFICGGCENSDNVLSHCRCRLQTQKDKLVVVLEEQTGISAHICPSLSVSMLFISIKYFLHTLDYFHFSEDRISVRLWPHTPQNDRLSG